VGQASLVAARGEALAFRVGGERLALDLGDVREVLRPRLLTRVPHGPASLLGLANLRGAVMPVLSLAVLLGQEAAAPGAASRILVVDKVSPVGLLVDEVASRAMRVEERRIDLDALLARDFGGLIRRTAREAVAPAPAAAPAGGAAAGMLGLIGFTLAGQEYALPLGEVAEVARLPATLATLPETDQAMLGIASFRSGLLPLVSPRILLGLPAQGWSGTKGRLIVVRMGGFLVGLVVDAVTAILRLPEAAIDPVPPVLTRGRAEARIQGICRLEGGGRLISLLNPDRLFDTETAARIQAAAAGEGAEMSGDDRQAGAIEQFVLFQLGEERYGLPIAAVEEVVRHPGTLTRIPHAPDFVEGVMNLRGKVVPVIDQRRRFAAGGRPAARGRRIVVVTIEGLRAGFAVDSVSEVVGLPADSLSPTPQLTAGDSRIFDRVATAGPDGRMTLLVDPKALLDRAERDLVAAIAAKAGVAPAS
jgi:purine-binding chemotaxis protein CheW